MEAATYGCPVSQHRLGPVKGKMNLLEGERYWWGGEGEKENQRRDILQRMMNNPKVHRYSTQTMKRRER